ncbi:hypothetical protein RND71_035795 [Anisodus tanguticus]|uniref:Uncharacterized protein n=1 Tax=Anisodus tanguticus TaxID=243964 RepID=A0AAE1R6J4_9SOLA|nr:hypothetical protein RND71_035795 [Anisodus tanguticus]
MNTLNPLPVASMFTQQPLNSRSFRTPLPLSIKPSSPKSKPLKSLTPLSFLKPTLISTITATTLFFTSFNLNPQKAISTPLSPPPTIDTNVNEITEKPLEQVPFSNPNNVSILKNLLENKVKNRELVDAISILNKLIELEPNEIEWRFLKSHLYVHNGEVGLAKLGFRDIILKDPYYIEAYRGLVAAAMEDEEMNEIEKKIEEGINMCSMEGNKESELRDLKLLLAQIWVIEGKYDEALKVYRELVDEEPGDFRPYLCQGMIYTALKKNDEAEKYFEKYRGLVPREHPNARFEFMMST